MKKNKLAKLALLGLTNGLILNSASLLANQQEAPSYLAAGCGAKCSTLAAGCGAKCSTASRDANATAPRLEDPSATDDYSASQSTDLMTEDDLIKELSPETVKLYKSLSPEGKLLARQMASQVCKGMNGCKGQNACKSKDNSCKGKGSCKGMSVCAFPDKNDAVKIAGKLMAEKRAKLQH